MTHILHNEFSEKILNALKDQAAPMKLERLSAIVGVTGREIDRTLQRLRTQGAIEFVKGAGCGWRIPVRK